MKKINRQLWLHLLFSLISFLFILQGGEFIKYMFAPYAFYLVWSEKPYYWPAIVVLSATGTTLSYFILITCIILSFRRLPFIIKSRKLGIFLLLILFLPIFIYQFLERLNNIGLGFSASLTPTEYYLAIFPFFHGLILSRRISSISLNLILYPLILLFIATNYIFQLSNFNLHVNTFTTSILTTIGILAIIDSKIRNEIKISYKIIGYISLLLIFTGTISLELHLSLSILIGCLIIFAFRNRIRLINYFFVKPYVLVILLLVTSVVIRDSLKTKFSKEVNIDYTDFASYPSIIKWKLYGDRGVVWTGVWNKIYKEGTLLPPVRKVLYSFDTIEGNFVKDVEYGAHNLFLELPLRLGWVTGITILIILFIIVFRSGEMFIDKSNQKYSTDTYILGACSMGMAFSIILTGQFILLSSFSYMFFSIFGILTGIQIKKNYEEQQANKSL